MPKFFLVKADPENKEPHQHLVYLDDLMAYHVYGGDHTHTVTFEPDSGKYVLSDEGHKHLPLEEIDLKPKKKKLSDEEKSKIFYEMIAGYQETESFESQLLETGQQAYNFYLGDQWEAEDRAKRDLEQRATLQLNLLQRGVLFLSGIQRQHRADISIVPVEGGDALVAQVLDFLVKHVCNKNNFDLVENEVFLDQVITGRGVFTVYGDMNVAPGGDIVIEKCEWDSIRLGPHLRIDGRDCEYELKWRWDSLEKMKERYPKNAEDIENITGDVSIPIPATDFIRQFLFTTTNGVKMVRTVEYQKNQHLTVSYGYSKIDNVEFRLENIPTALIKELEKDEENWIVIDKVQTDRQVFVYVGGYLVKNYTSPYSTSNNAIAYCIKKGNIVLGKLTPAIDAQKELNLVHSQMIDIGSRHRDVIFAEPGAFVSPLEQQKLTATSSGPLPIVNLTEGGLHKIEEFHAGTIPQDMVNRATLAALNIQQLLGINESGEEQTTIAGQNDPMSFQHHLLGNEFLFDNLAIAKRKVGRLILESIREYYTLDKVLRLIQTGSSKGELSINGEPVTDDMIAKIKTLWSDMNLICYDVEVSESKYSPTNRIKNLKLLETLTNARVPLPQQFLMESYLNFADIPGKEKAIAEMKQQQQAQAQQEAQKGNTEIQKTQMKGEMQQQLEQMKEQFTMQIKQMELQMELFKMQSKTKTQ